MERFNFVFNFLRIRRREIISIGPRGSFDPNIKEVAGDLYQVISIPVHLREIDIVA